MNEPIPRDRSSLVPSEGSNRSELEGILKTLREAGVMHVIDALFGKLGTLSEAVLDRLENDSARSALSGVAAAFDKLAALRGRSFKRFDRSGHEGSLARPGEVARSGGVMGTAELVRTNEDERPSLLSLLDLLNDSDTRRGVLALLIALRKLGEAVREAPDSA